jgi:hypothetical protein
MSKSNPSSVTAEEAVARMVNMDYIPEGFTLEDMLSAFQEEAEVEYDNAKIDRLPGPQIEVLKVRMEACEARRSLAQLLLEALLDEARNTNESMIIPSPDSSSKPRYTLESVADWASYKYGIGIPEWWSTDSDDPATSKGVPVDVTWEDIEIRIRKDNKIAYSHEKGKWTEKTFGEIGLLDRKKQKRNKHGNILIGLSQDKKFPKDGKRKPMDSTAISKLRTSLRKLTGITEEPFHMFNKTDGWKPRFKLTDDRKNADDRAKKAAIHTEYDEGINYADENDKAGKFFRGEK